MHALAQELKAVFRGDIDTSPRTLETYAHDASLFEIMPKMVVFPRDAHDMQTLVRFVSERKKEFPDLSLTVRAAGTDMSGGPLNDSIIVDVTRYMNRIIEVSDEYAIVEPGCFFRDLEKELAKQGKFFPPYTASKDLCALGGMYGNNCAGEKTLRYGKFERFILESHVVLSDGVEYSVRPEEIVQDDERSKSDGLLGSITARLMRMLSDHRESIASARPNVTKNSAGYALWNVWDRENGRFDLNQLLVGSQGTLGIVTRMKIRVVPREPQSGMLVVFLPDLSRLGEIAKVLASHQPDSLESFDDASLRLAFRFFFDFVKTLGVLKTLALGVRFIPELLFVLFRGMPRLVLIAEVTGKSTAHIFDRLEWIQQSIRHFGYTSRIVSKRGSEKYWRVRRESFNLLRHHVKGKKTAPFIDDVIVPVESLQHFLPNLTRILDRERIVYTIAGHAGDGNFHVIPLLDLRDPATKQRMLKVMDEVYHLVLLLGGSLTAEHNDGLIRAPYMQAMFGSFITGLFLEVKALFDPQGIFNPHKKINVSKDYMVSHIKNG